MRASCTCSAKPFMPLRMSVRPTANHTRTPLGTGITAAPAPRRPRPPKPETPKLGSGGGRGLQIRPRSPAWAAVRRGHRQPAPPAPEQSHLPPLADPGANGRSSSTSPRPDAPRRAPLHRVRTPPRQSPASARCSTGDAARDRPIPRRSPLHRLLHRCKHRCLHRYLPARSTRRSQDGLRRRVTNNLYKIWNRMSWGSYFPPPVRAVSIPKKSGGQRILGVPTVADRVAQMVVKQVIEPDLDPIFLPDSYGYRPRKSALDAVGVTRE